MQRYALNDPLVNVLIPLWQEAPRMASGTHGGRPYLSDGVAIVFLTPEQREAVLLGIGLWPREGLWTAPRWGFGGGYARLDRMAGKGDWSGAPDLSPQFPREADLVPMKMTWFRYGDGTAQVQLAATSEGALAAFDARLAPLWTPYSGAALRFWRDGTGMEALVGLGPDGTMDLVLAGMRPQLGLSWQDAVREAFGSLTEEVSHDHQ